MIIDKHQTTLNVHQLIRIDGHISKYSLYMPISTLEELKEICNICLHPKGWNLEKYNESHFADWGKTDKRSIIYKYQHAQSSKYRRYHQEGDPCKEKNSFKLGTELAFGVATWTSSVLPLWVCWATSIFWQHEYQIIECPLALLTLIKLTV